MNPRTAYRNYKDHNVNYQTWVQRAHAQEWLLHPENMGSMLSIDEVSLSQGELYTFITNREGKGKQGTLLGCVRGTRSSDIVRLLARLDPKQRNQVQEVSLDMAKNMEAAIKKSFPKANLVTDRFHVIALAQSQLQHLRTQLWRGCLDQENEAMEQAKKQGKTYRAVEYSNGDTPKQLLARCRFALFKPETKWTPNQYLRMRILFEHYPSLKCGWQHVQDLSAIFAGKDKTRAYHQIMDWIQVSQNPNLKTWNELEIQTLKQFSSVAKSIKYHLESILNFFNNRSTNANAESFNAKIKLFRSKLKGVRDTTFFLFRLSRLFA